MKTRILFTLMAALMVVYANAQWTLDSVNTAGLYPFAGTAGDKAVFSNGTEWNVFDVVSGAHTYGTLNISRQMIEAVSSGGKVFFGGGKYGSFADPLYTKKVDVYNAATNTWSVWNMGTAREVGGAAAIGGKVVFAGGTGRSDIAGPVYMYNKVDIFDIATGARTAGKLSKARSNIAAGAAGNKIVFAGGWYWDMMYSVLPANTVDIYDVTTGLWTKTTLSKKRENIAVAVVGDKILFAGGTGNMGAVTNVDIYNATTNTWSVTYLPAAREGMKSAVIGNDAYFAGGLSGVVNAIYKYNTVTGIWTTLYMPTSLSGFSMSIIDSRLIFAGGTIPGTNIYSNLVQIYDPVANSWANESLSIARTNVSALSIGNKGVFVGGTITYGYPTAITTRRVDIYEAPFRESADVISIMPDWDVLVYPNPAHKYIQIYVNNDAVLPLDAVIMDQNGRKVIGFPVVDEVTTVDIIALPAGMYILAIQDMYGKKVTTKLIKR